MDRILWVILMTAIAGVVGTGLGGVVGAILKKDSSKVVSLLLAFAGGIMLAVVCFDMIPAAFLPEGADKEMPLLVIIGGVFGGYALVYFLNRLIDKRINPEIQHIDSLHPKTADDLNELIHADHFEKHLKDNNKRELFVAGLVMAFAIALHNLPEGMVIGASYAADFGSFMSGAGFITALVIGLHNIPEGMSVSVPLVSGGTKPWKAILITASSGIPTVVGAIIGYSLGLAGPIWLCLA